MSSISATESTAMFAAVPDRPYDPTLTAGAQARQLLTTTTSKLEQVGATPADVMFVQIIVADRAFVAEVNEAWDEWIDPDSPPSRACIVAGLASADMKVEMIFTVALSGN
ncbi:MAG: Rid family hydrolase [Pseudomonadota bacterium]|nr:Rid family hydrolase [Pseudomonadota bacterium]